ncbi:hypothetical protein I7I51_04384 [Histoplasma capsulatum]|uniref:Altered inheritance of mitochondria protein 9, mitochondrial n=1 Tax=Ajellomyces capsulatus TaxID=5037 RepID=A0A8A1MDH4_AJECA|nr:hypothetical protein I7I51_04384 [Histoplasma capsulatum]
MSGSDQWTTLTSQSNQIGVVENSAFASFMSATIAEGSFNKTFRLAMDNESAAIAKIPHPIDGPKYYTTAPEVATMDFEAPGTKLEDVWDHLPLEDRIVIMKDLLLIENKLLSVSFSCKDQPSFGPNASLKAREDKMCDPITFVNNTWDDDLLPLRGSLINVEIHWPKLGFNFVCPIRFTEEELQARTKDGNGGSCVAHSDIRKNNVLFGPKGCGSLDGSGAIHPVLLSQFILVDIGDCLRRN